MKKYYLLCLLLTYGVVGTLSAANQNAAAANSAQMVEIPEHIMKALDSSYTVDSNEMVIEWLQEDPETRKNARAGGLSLLFLLLQNSYSLERRPTLLPALKVLLTYEPTVILQAINAYTAYTNILATVVRGRKGYTNNESSGKDTPVTFYHSQDTVMAIARLFLRQGYDWLEIKEKLLASKGSNPKIIHAVIQEIEQEISVAQELRVALKPHLLPELVDISQDYSTNLLKREKKKAHSAGAQSK